MSKASWRAHDKITYLSNTRVVFSNMSFLLTAQPVCVLMVAVEPRKNSL
jgi:hypothetical protein